MSKILEVDDLRVTFHTYAGDVKAVRGVSFYLEPGETLAFVGESGCGKTVTAKAVMRLLKQDIAEIEPTSIIKYQGEDVLAMNKKRLCDYRGNDVSMIFQDPMSSLNPTMTCGKQVVESLVLHRGLDKEAAWKEALRMFELVKIPDAAKRLKAYPHQLSGGMRQRVMIAIALANNPKILIADEPTTALDVTIQAQIMDLLNELKKELNTAIILVTHDLGVVANFADRIQVMYAGQVVERGTAREIFYQPKHPYTWALLSSVPKLAKNNKEELYALKGTPPDLILPLNHCPFADRCQYCMKICKEKMPPVNQLTPSQSTSCWLTHKNAPKVTPLYVKEDN